MNDPYPVGDLRRNYFDYFSRLCKNVRNILLTGKQLDLLLYLVEHPLSSAYDIEPGSKANESPYRGAKATINQLHKFGLIELIAIGEHSSKDYSLTDEGICYLIRNTKLPNSTLLQVLFKNYSNSNIFQYLVYPYIKPETSRSPKMDLNIVAGVGNYLVSILQKMDSTLLLLDEQKKSKNEIYSWNYDKLEEYLRNKYHYDFVNIADCEEDSDEDYIKIRYFDYENKNNDVKAIFNKRSKEGYVYVTDKKARKHKIPLVTDYVQKKTITQYDHMIGYFDAFCSPQAEEFILSITSINIYNDDVREVLSNDKAFMNALKETKDHFDWAYRQIISYPDFIF